MGREWHLAHCIASDLRMSKGIAVKMQKKFGLRGKIRASRADLKHPTCVHTGRVFNLITKKKSPGKPTPSSLRASVEMMRDQAVADGVEMIAMPRIGCGRDRLKWPRVREDIKEIFAETDIEIMVCRK